MALPDPTAAEETSPGGSSILRHEDIELEYRDSDRQPKNTAAIIRHLTPILGDRHIVYPLPAENEVKVDLILFPPSSERLNWTIVTTGMSDRPMTLDTSIADEDREQLQYAELSIALAPDAFKMDAGGHISDDQFRTGQQAWLVGLLAILAHLPHDYGTWLGVGHSVPNGDPAEPYTSYVGFSGVVLGTMSQSTCDAAWTSAALQFGGNDGKHRIDSGLRIALGQFRCLGDGGYEFVLVHQRFPSIRKPGEFDSVRQDLDI